MSDETRDRSQRRRDARELLRSILDLGRDRDPVPDRLYDDIVAYLAETDGEHERRLDR